MIEQQSQSSIRKSLLQQQLHQNVIKVTRKIIRPMTEMQRFQKAKAHIIDALKYKHPRFQSESLSTSHLFKILYKFQQSLLWQWLLFFCGYIFLMLAAFDNQSYLFKIACESVILFLFWVHIGIFIYCKQFDNFVKKIRYSTFFYFKIVIIILMTVDLALFIAFPCYDCRPIRPFRILRCFVPILFDEQMRKSLMAFKSAYKDVLVFFIFYAIIIVGYALIGSRGLTFDPNYQDPNYPIPFDPYKTNYRHLQKMIFMTYVSGTYDAYPDNQLLAIQNYQPNYLYYIAFIFLNLFIFSSIPGSLIYLRYRDTRSKILLIDQIRQQHSLILAFVTLAEDASNLSIDKLIKFLLYLYRYKIRYIGYITDICLKLDDHNNQSIQVNQFMQLCKILLDNSAMMPPSFDDVLIWLRFRKFMNKRLNLKKIVKHWGFSLAVSIIIILAFTNEVYYLITYPNPYTYINDALNDLFVSIFLLELLIRLVAIGPENYFSDKWNIADSVLIIISFSLSFFSNNHLDGLVIIWRIFKIGTILEHKSIAKRVTFPIYLKLKSLFEIILEIMPIILRFMPLFIFFFYIYASIGIQIFYDIYSVPGNPAYNQYEQFGNFQSLVHGQYVLVQILTEAGWSQVAYDHSSRSPQNFALIMLYFCFIHITLVCMISALIKGIFWQVFFTVNTIFADRKKEVHNQQLKQEEINRKTKEIIEINQTIENNQYIQPNTVIKRQLIQNKFDEQIFKKLRKVFDNDKRNKLKQPQQLLNDWQIDIDQLSEKSKMKYKKKKGIHRSQRDQDSSQSRSRNEVFVLRASQGGQVLSSSSALRHRMSMVDTQQIDEEDLQDEIEQILDKLLINPSIKYHQIVAHPKLFVEFLRSKLKDPEQLKKQFQYDLHKHPLENQESMQYHIYSINGLLKIEISKREQKSMIIKNLVEENIIDQEQAQRLIKKKLHQNKFKIDTSGTLRKMFLKETNEDLIRKFEIEYFSDLYGYTYRQINKMTLQPLLKYEATLTYSLKNIMRYPQINNIQFFQMITSIQDQMSNQLLKKGSLFKFIYKLHCKGDIWFSIQYKRNQELKVHFIKSGLWCYEKENKQKNILYGKDIFNWDYSKNGNHDNVAACQKYIKLFYQSFQGLAFSLLNKDNFFKSNPKDFIYDLYIQHFDVQGIKRLKPKKLPISKIMVVVLSKEVERVEVGLEPLNYNLTDIEMRHHHHHLKRKGEFQLDESDDETFEKLKNLAAMEVQKIIESEGLPFSYILNLMKQISDTIQIYGQNFVSQIEKVLNDKYEASREQNMGKAQSQKSQSVRTMQIDDSVRLL